MGKIKISALFIICIIKKTYKKRLHINNKKYLGGVLLKGVVEERAKMLEKYILKSKATVRSAAQKFGVSKSTVHKDIS